MSVIHMGYICTVCGYSEQQEFECCMELTDGELAERDFTLNHRIVLVDNGRSSLVLGDPLRAEGEILASRQIPPLRGEEE